jgi:hypothetical protein
MKNKPYLILLVIVFSLVVSSLKLSHNLYDVIIESLLLFFYSIFLGFIFNKFILYQKYKHAKTIKFWSCFFYAFIVVSNFLIWYLSLDPEL